MQRTPNYNLATYSITQDLTVKFKDYRNNIAGVDSTSNMGRIDTQMKINSDVATEARDDINTHLSSSSAHDASNLVNDSQSVSGAKVSNALDSLSGRIDALDPATGNVNTTLGVYKRTDNSNTNDYAVTVSGVSLVNNLRLNLEVGNSNTGASTLNWNGTGAKDIVWLSENTNYPVAVNMVDGITELQYLSSIDKWVVLSKSGLKPSTDITQTTSIDQVGGATFKDAVVNGIAPSFGVKGKTFVNLNDNGVDYVHWSIFGSGTTKGADGIHLVADTTADGAVPSFEFKESTEYTIVYRIRETDIEATGMFLLNNLTGGNIDLVDDIGIHAVVLTTQSTLTTNTARFFMSSTEPDGNYVDFEVYAILEGDQTSEDITQELDFGINSSNGEIVVRGKNHVTEVELGRIGPDGSNSTENSSIRSKNIDSIPADTEVTFSVSGIPNIDISSVLVAYYDSTGSFVIRETEISPIVDEGTFTTRENISGFRLYAFSLKSDNSDITQQELSSLKVQVELGDTATDYAPYTESRYAYEGKSVSNGTADKINVLTGEGEQAVSDVFTFDGTRSWTNYITGQGSNSDLSRIQIDGFLTDNNITLIQQDDTALAYDGLDFYKVVASTGSLGTEKGMILDSSGSIRIYVPTSELPSDNLAGFLSYLGTNNLKAQFQLATPIIEQLESEQFKLDNGGTIQDISAVQSSKVYQVNLNTETRDNNTAKVIPRLENDIERVESLAKDLSIARDGAITGSNYEIEVGRDLVQNEVMTVIPDDENTGAVDLIIDGVNYDLFKIQITGDEVEMDASDIYLSRPFQVYVDVENKKCIYIGYPV